MVTASIVAMIGWFPSVILLIALLIFTFFLLAIVCDEALAPTLEELSDTWKIPHDVACATFLAAGSSAPEISISIMSVLHGKSNAVDISLGALMGSALIAFTVIPSCCILVSPNRQLKLDLVPLSRDVLFFCCGLIWVVHSSRDGVVTLTESLLLVIMFFAYLLAMKLLAPFYKHDDNEHHFLSEDFAEEDVKEEEKTASEIRNGGGRTNGKSEYGALDEEKLVEGDGHHLSQKEGDQTEGEEANTRFGNVVRSLIPPFNFNEDAIRQQYYWILFISIFYISILSEMTLYFAEALSDLVGVNHHLTGLVLVALGAQGTFVF
jgi:Ca2+/Na+ antiporter